MATIRKEDAIMTSEEMLDRNATWTLACDNALLNRLKAFSENLAKNSQELTKECDTLSKDISHLDYNLRNVTNQFLMMSNTQFVENRVEEFKEFSSPVSPPPNSRVSLKSKADKETELMSKMKQAIQFGLKACDRKRQDGEDEIPPDKLFIRKRPFLIGSPKFFSSKYCGLVDESRRVVPSWEMGSDADSIKSQTPSSDIVQPQPEMKPAVTFTMPPPSVPVFPVPENNLDIPHNHQLNHDNSHIGKGVIPPSPTISDRSSSDLGKPSSSASVSRENVPRSVTDELNKIYGSFVPPPHVDDDSDDDFQPNSSAGRIFEEDDDDLFGEKELFPKAQKNSDFFSRSNPSQLPAPPVFTVPPPVNPVPQPQSGFSNNNSARTLVGPSPKSSDIPNMSNAPVEGSKKDASTKEAPLPEVEVGSGSVRSKLPPGAVSMFGGMPPPIFNNDKLQAGPTTKTEAASSLPSNQNANRIETSSRPAATLSRKDSESGSSHHNKQENVNTKRNTSQPGVVAPPRKADNISRGSLGSSGDLQKQRTTNKVTPSSLFEDDSSDEDIFKSNRRQSQTNVVQKQNDNIRDILHQPTPPVNKAFSATVSAPTPAAKTATKLVVQRHQQIKKSIFDDSESDDDLFASKPSSSTAITRKENSSAAKDFVKPEAKKIAVPKQTKKASLFGDDSDSDTDLFGNKKIVQIQSRKAEPRPTPKTDPAPAPKSRMEEKVEQDNSKSGLGLGKEAFHSAVIDVESNPVLNNNHIDIIDDDSHSVTKTSEIVKSPSSDVVINKDEKSEKQKSGNSSRVKKSIFDDSDSDDDLFTSKSKKVAVKVNKSVKSSVDASENQPIPKQTSNPTHKNKKPSLFEDESDSDNDIFSSKSKKKGIKFSERKEEPIPVEDACKAPVTEKATPVPEKEESSVEPMGKDDTTDDLDLFLTSPVKVDEVPNISDIEKSTDDIVTVKDEPIKSTKAVGNKISEKIKAMQSGNSDASKTDDSSDSAPKKPIKSSVSVKNLALNLKINPLALKVGARPPKPSGSSPSTPEKETNDVPSSPGNDNSTSAATTTTNDDTTTTENTKTRSTSASPKEELGVEDILYNKISSKDEKDNNSDPALKKPIKSSVSVKNLALNLKINPLALKGGARPPKPSGSTPSTPEKEANDVPSSPSNDNSMSTTTGSISALPKDEMGIEEILYDKINSKDETDQDDHSLDEPSASPSKTIKNDGGDHFVEIIKARAKVQQKRRPPSKKFLKSLAAHTEREEETETTEVKENEVNANEEEASESEDSNST